MWQQYRRGEWCDVGEVGADAVQSLLLTAPEPESGQSARLHLRGARITGALDLADADIGVPVRMHRCTFASPLLMRGARVNALVLVGCEVPGIVATGAASAREVKIVDCVVDGTLDLRSFRVGAWLSLDDSRIEGPPRRPALDAQSLGVAMGLSAAGLVCNGAVLLHSANVEEYLGFRGAQLLGPEARFRAPELVVGGSLHLDRGFVNEGPTNLYRASIGGSLHLEEATLTGRGMGRGQAALGLVCATVEGNIQAGDGLRVSGCIDLRDTQIRGTVNLDGARVDNPSARRSRPSASRWAGTCTPVTATSRWGRWNCPERGSAVRCNWTAPSSPAMKASRCGHATSWSVPASTARADSPRTAPSGSAALPSGAGSPSRARRSPHPRARTR